MEKQKRTNIVALLALVVAVVGLTFGYAALSKTLDITSNATVTPKQETFNIDFSTATDSTSTSNMTVTATEGAGGEATITNDSATTPSLSDLTTTFTNIGQTVTYTFYARNVGEYDAWLKSVNFENPTDASKFITCTAGAGTNADMVKNACDTIGISIKVGSDEALTGTATYATSTHSLGAGDSEPIVVTVSYKGDSNVTNSGRADGPFTVKFGKISLTYSSVK